MSVSFVVSSSCQRPRITRWVLADELYNFHTLLPTNEQRELKQLTRSEFYSFTKVKAATWTIDYLDLHSSHRVELPESVRVQ